MWLCSFNSIQGTSAKCVWEAKKNGRRRLRSSLIKIPDGVTHWKRSWETSQVWLATASHLSNLIARIHFTCKARSWFVPKHSIKGQDIAYSFHSFWGSCYLTNRLHYNALTNHRENQTKAEKLSTFSLKITLWNRFFNSMKRQHYDSYLSHRTETIWFVRLQTKFNLMLHSWQATG